MASSALAAEPRALLHVVDDQGKTVEEALDLCFHIDLRTDCKRLIPAEEFHTPPVFYSVRIEGEHHGPLALRREQLQAEADGSFRISVARKALLHIDGGLRPKPLAISLYPPNDLTFREPAFRATLQPSATAVNVPAGEFVASLATA